MSDETWVVCKACGGPTPTKEYRATLEAAGYKRCTGCGGFFSELRFFNCNKRHYCNQCWIRIDADERLAGTC